MTIDHDLNTTYSFSADDVIESVWANDVNDTVDELGAMMGIGSSQLLYKPCIRIMGNQDYVNARITLDGEFYEDPTGAGGRTRWEIPLETNKSGKKLYIKGWKGVIWATSASNKVTAVDLFGWNGTGSFDKTGLTDGSLPYVTEGEHAYSGSAIDMSAYLGAFLMIFYDSSGSPPQLMYTGWNIEYYYA